MKTRIIQCIPVLLAVLLIGFRYFSQWCILTNSSCYGTWVHWIYLEVTSPIFFFAIFFLPIAIILVFVRWEVFKSWLKLALWAVPLLLLLISTQPVYAGFLSTDRDDAARLAGGVFAGVSLCLIIWRLIVARRSVKQ
ncbi:MAG: hypothetical protein PHD04_03885 [Candidatus Pacebacteria bacterium]|nr:hypothetical protein [Candidatus Paceibacterota bacterium]